MDLTQLLEGLQGDTQAIVNTINENAKSKGIKIFFDDGQKNVYIPKARLDSQIIKTANLEEQLKSHTESIKTLEKLTKDNETAQTTISELNASVNTMKTKLMTNSLDSAIRLKAIELNALDATGGDLLAFINKDSLKVKDDGSIEGLDAQIDTLKTNKAYLFKATEPTEGTPGAGTGNPNNSQSGAAFGSPKYKPGQFGTFLATQPQNGGQPTDANPQLDPDTFFK